MAPRYFVGSFDDDSSYILTARALLHGQGLTGHLASGAVVAGVYPPGYPAVLTPLAWLWPHTFVPMRLLSALCYAGLFPLTWLYLRRRGVHRWLVTSTLLLLALGPAFATFGSMVMAETPFLVVFVAWLLLIGRWEHQASAFTGTGLAVVLTAGALIWLKEAAVGMVVGLALWELLGRGRGGVRARLPTAVSAAVGPAMLILPVIVARISAGVPVAGSRYSQELGAYYQGGLGSRLVHVVPHGLWQLLTTAVGATLVPYLSPLPTSSGALSVLGEALSWHVTILAGVGAVVWFRRHRDAAIAIVPVYLVETLLWPYVNERRVILVLPVIAAWYVIGAAATWRAVAARMASRHPRRVPTTRKGAVALAAVVVVIPLLAQLPRDYLFKINQSGSHFGGSRYAAVLSRVGDPSDPVETDYLFSTALFTGHRTARSAFDATLAGCYLPGVVTAIDTDRPGFLLVGDVNKPGVMDSPCLLGLGNSQPWAVRLLQTTRDDASVFELIGPGTTHPDLTDALRHATFRQVGSEGTVTYQWALASRSLVRQVSVGAAAFSGDGSATSQVTVQIEVAGGKWTTVESARSGVGDGTGYAPFLLAALPNGVEATGVRVIVEGHGSASAVADVHALSSGAGG